MTLRSGASSALEETECTLPDFGVDEWSVCRLAPTAHAPFPPFLTEQFSASDAVVVGHPECHAASTERHSPRAERAPSRQWKTIGRLRWEDRAAGSSPQRYITGGGVVPRVARVAVADARRAARHGDRPEARPAHGA